MSEKSNVESYIEDYFIKYDESECDEIVYLLEHLNNQVFEKLLEDPDDINEFENRMEYYKKRKEHSSRYARVLRKFYNVLRRYQEMTDDNYNKILEALKYL